VPVAEGVIDGVAVTLAVSLSATIVPSLCVEKTTWVSATALATSVPMVSLTSVLDRQLLLNIKISREIVRISIRLVIVHQNLVLAIIG
jgi:hypothetical protein